MICEAYSFATEDPSGTSHRTLLAHRHELSARRISLTHLGPAMARHLADAEFEVAADGQTLTL